MAGIEAAIRRFHVAQVTPDDARLAPAARLTSRERAFQTCFSGEGIVGMHVAAELDLHGAVRQAEVTLLEGVTGSERALENLRACLTRVVRETPFPCPAAEGTRVEANVCFQARQGAVGCVASGLRRAASKTPWASWSDGTTKRALSGRARRDSVVQSPRRNALLGCHARTALMRQHVLERALESCQ
ncbi:MAG: hypothetical protein H6722_08245 [Sandaracinus sp.]|nr:hypothetical protein [Sandaracinus sp.]